MDREAFGQAVPVAEGFWILATRHRPGLSKRMFEINNRALIFRLNDGGRPVLLVANAVDPAQSLDEVRRLEKETGLRVRYILSVGGGHHLHLDPWIDAFPEAQILLPPVRVPRTRHGQTLMQNPRVRAMDLQNPLPQFKGQLDAHIFHGLVGFPDERTPAEGGSDGLFNMMKVMAMMMISGPKDPVDELWLRHVPTDTVIAGENLAWYYPADEYKKLPFMAKKMLKPDKVWLMEMARKVKDPAAASACWKEILSWPVTTLMTYHDPPTRAIVDDPHGALERAVRDAKQL
jgi:hypothetical protein